MRILFIHKNFPGQFLHLAPALAARGHQVRAFATTPPPGVPPSAPAGVEVIHYSPSQAPGQDIHPWLGTLQREVVRGESVATLAMRLRTTEGYVPDLVCGHTGWGEMLFIKDVWPETRLLSFVEFCNVPHNGSYMGFDPEFRIDDPRLSMIMRLKNASHLVNLDAADRVLCPTRFQQSTLPELYRSRVAVIHEGVNTDAICPDPHATCVLPDGTTLRRDDEVITFVTRNIEPVRGYHRFMRALPEILRRRPRARVLIIGSPNGGGYGWSAPAGQSWQQIYLDEVKDRIDLQRVHFLGLQPRAALTRLLQLSSVHVYLTYPFVLSWSMLEAMSCGALVVGSATAPVMEVIEDGKNGLLVDFFSQDALCDAVSRVFEHPDRMQSLRDAARRTIVERYDVARVCLPQQVALIESMTATS